MDHTPILRLLAVLNLAKIEHIQKLVHAAVEGKERVSQLLDLEAIWEGQARPVLNLEQMLEWFELILLKEFDCWQNQTICEKLVQGLVCDTYNPGELFRNFY